MGIYNILNTRLRHHVLVTGGEPLMQGKTVELLKQLSQRGHIVQVETNGSRTIPLLPRIHWVVDRKTPSSGMENQNMTPWVFSEQIKDIQYHGSHAYIKWVVADEEDTNFVIQDIESLIYHGNMTPFIISPIHAYGHGIPEIVETIRTRDRSLLDYITFSIQLHKLFEMD